MRGLRALGALFGSALVGAVLLLGRPEAGAQSATFLATFDGTPGAPTTASLPGWAVQRHSRDTATWDTPEMMEAAHGTDCAPLNADGTQATHHVMTYDDMVFQCRDHVMTSINAIGYGVIYLTPPALADFSSGPATIGFDVSTKRTSTRDWWDIWVTPPADAMALPLDSALPDLFGEPKNGIHIKMDSFTSGGVSNTYFVGTVFTNGVATALTSTFVGYEQKLTPSAVRRDPFQLTVSPTHITFGLLANPACDPNGACGPTAAFNWINKDLATPLAWTAGVVQIGHHSYNPTKDCPVGATCAANTWHWDNVRVAPSLPYAATPVATRHIAQQTDFTLPPGTGRTLAFGANGNSVNLSFDSGVTWTVPVLVPSAAPNNDPSHVRSYTALVPDGATQARMRGALVYSGAGTPSLWEPYVRMGATVATPTPSPTATPSPIPSPTPTATPTPADVCRSVYRRNGVLTDGPVIVCP